MRVMKTKILTFEKNRKDYFMNEGLNCTENENKLSGPKKFEFGRNRILAN